ncbi:2-hydroxyacid dehydrogenase [Azospirillum rugosum]|uniref:Phosphoglycerate dehydrogenase-like enzyme n=1 Tax=Azospirillum rugosum TaxID=416170 RepID=A0ABS4SMF6_9PROT|nr:2-hydroxyacid dehydrogenase [Azospirillum rugosum]MBP2293667.1 phosphoglycerate dehydrogenase-like enzyme [Azospirillum rugosum]MDQ0527212.1 phosphoglycerate dehydrogenase-like enzyme [Azospirillum rugosum]
MKVFMIGEAAHHKEKLAAFLKTPCEIVALPREAASSSEFDSAIGRDDIVVSLRFARKDGPAPAFRLLHVPGAGLDGIDMASLPAGCTVCNVFEHEIPIAEFVLAAMLQWEIRLDELRGSFSTDRWPDVYRARVPHGEIYGKTLGLIGFGRIGRTIARRARAFGMRVIALDAMPSAPGDLADAVLPPSGLPELLADADFLVVSCPLTEQTRGLIGADQFRAMKPSAVLINVSRAPIVDEAALYDALSRRTIAGAFLDVWYGYPTGSDDRVPPSRFRFEELPNAFCTPHSSAWTSSLPERRYAFIAQNIDRLRAGEPLVNVVRAPSQNA